MFNTWVKLSNLCSAGCDFGRVWMPGWYELTDGLVFVGLGDFGETCAKPITHNAIPLLAEP